MALLSTDKMQTLEPKVNATLINLSGQIETINYKLNELQRSNDSHYRA